MKKVFIKYNPYKLETELTVNGNGLAQNSVVGEKISSGSRLQEWIEELPGLLIDEYNDNEFEITFHGTMLDYEDVAEVFTKASDDGLLTGKLDRIPAKETTDKEPLIEAVFDEIQNGPFEELKDVEIISAFQHAKSSDFEVCVVATMSAGKSTLINSMLGDKLMPSKQEACTAIITRIKDDDSRDNWQAEVYDKNDILVETHEVLTCDTMDRLNSDERISTIKVTGNIPFVEADDVSLVLIDTPGPNNARDPEHKKVQSEFLSKSSKSLVLYIMTGTFGSNDDNELLRRVADSMKVGGKQSKDRFIFVVNKMDDRRKEDGDPAQTLERVRTYLKGHGVSDPNVFPAAALPALNIRLMEKSADLDEDTIDETEMTVRKLRRNQDMHYETYAPLPASVRGIINDRVANAINNEDAKAEALVHTGVPCVEAAIRQYVQKYAKTAKIKNIVDTFVHKLDEVGCFEETKQELAKNRDDSERIAQQMQEMRKKIDDANSAVQFKKSVDSAVVNVNDESKETVETIVGNFQMRLTQRIDSVRGRELDVSEAEREVDRLKKYVQDVEVEFQEELEELIVENLVNTSNALIEEYRKKVSSIIDDNGSSLASVFAIDPIKLIGGGINSVKNFSVRSLVKSKRVEDGEKWVVNEDKKWYKPWTWFQESGHWETKYKNVEYISASDLCQEYLSPVQDALYDNGDAARKYALKQANRIASMFEREFGYLDQQLKAKLAELESYAVDREKAEERIRETQKKLDWLSDIRSKIESILDI